MKTKVKYELTTALPSIYTRFNMHVEYEEFLRIRLSSSILVHILVILLRNKAAAQEECSSTHFGVTYMGSVNVSKDGYACQHWAVDIPHPIRSTIRDSNFPDGSKQAARNYCRNPLPAERHSPWCYTMNKVVAWQFCDICPKNNSGFNVCTLQDKGINYNGKVAYTRAFVLCRYWLENPVESFVFPEGSAAEAKNYCRNPDPLNFQGPWCYTSFNATTWDYCDVCLPFRGTVRGVRNMKSSMGKYVSQMSWSACLQFCIIFTNCASIDYSTKTKNCYYQVSQHLQLELTDEYNHYKLTRICRSRTSLRPAYFTALVGVSMEQEIKAPSRINWNACENYCVQHAKCVLVEMLNGTRCVASISMENVWDSDALSQARIITRCDPFLFNLQDDSKLVRGLVRSSRFTDFGDPMGQSAGKGSAAGYIHRENVALEASSTSMSMSAARAICCAIGSLTVIGLGGTAYAHRMWTVYKK